MVVLFGVDRFSMRFSSTLIASNMGTGVKARFFLGFRRFFSDKLKVSFFASLTLMIGG